MPADKLFDEIEASRHVEALKLRAARKIPFSWRGLAIARNNDSHYRQVLPGVMLKSCATLTPALEAQCDGRAMPSVARHDHQHTLRAIDDHGWRGLFA